MLQFVTIGGTMYSTVQMLEPILGENWAEGYSADELWTTSSGSFNFGCYMLEPKEVVWKRLVEIVRKFTCDETLLQIIVSEPSDFPMNRNLLRQCADRAERYSLSILQVAAVTTLMVILAHEYPKPDVPVTVPMGVIYR
jgi:hypothetical protein